LDENDVIKMDPYILLSWINMKLRDEYGDLQDLTKSLDISQEDIMNKLKAIGYSYNPVTNQFIGR
jgi:hypothetical protein